MSRLLGILALLAAAPALAWESTCYTYPDRALEPGAYAGLKVGYCAPEAGPNTARQRWIGGLDEHRLIWEQTRERAGLPASVSATMALRVFTSSVPLQVGGQTLTSLVPVPFEEASRTQTRPVSVGELAQLPDFSFALWDWASGHETCPIGTGPLSAEECHDFASHMGPVNSNHFLPQAGSFYARYHALALERAAACKTMRDQLAGTGERFGQFAKACELEALSLESVGQHFLQDAWSMGHMWQRWGSPNLSDFPPGDEQRDRAVLVALAAGLIHGARGVLQRLPAWTSYDVNDALCAPHESVRMIRNDGAHLPGLGDDYLQQLPELSSQAAYGDQARSLYSCAASGMLEVYAAAGANHGPASPPQTGLASVDPTGASCFGQRATNASMLTAAAIQLKVAGQQITLTLDSRFVGWMVPKVARQTGSVPVSAKLRNQFRFELQRVVSLTRLLAAKSPQGTEVADGRLGEFLGAKPNGAYAGALASYMDPPLPWPASPGDAVAQERAAGLARLFHQAHAADWCGVMDAAKLSALQSNTSNSLLDAEGQAAACEACAEFAVRHLRVGGAGSYDPAQEPLCHYLVTAPAFIYQAGTGTPSALAKIWCGCPG